MGSYSYAVASIEFIRGNPWGIFKRFFIIGVALVAISYCGVWINPAATPARVALAIITILTVISNYNAASAMLPVGSRVTQDHTAA